MHINLQRCCFYLYCVLIYADKVYNQTRQLYVGGYFCWQNRIVGLTLYHHSDALYIPKVNIGVTAICRLLKVYFSIMECRQAFLIHKLPFSTWQRFLQSSLFFACSCSQSMTRSQLTVGLSIQPHYLPFNFDRREWLGGGR